MQRDPEAIGAFLIDIERLIEAVEGAFGGTEGRPVIVKARPTQMWLDTKMLDQQGHSVEQVAEFIQSLTQEDVAGASGTQTGEAGDHVFQAVFPTSTLEALPCLPQAANTA